MIYLVLKGLFQFSEICDACNVLTDNHYLVGVSESIEHDRKICDGCFRILSQNPVDKLKIIIEKDDYLNNR